MSNLTTWGEVTTNLIGDLERIQTRRRQLIAKIEEAFLTHHLEQILNTLSGFGPTNRRQNPCRDRRPPPVQERLTPRRLRRPGASVPPIRQ